MKLTMTSEQEILQEGLAVLIEHLGVPKTARFLSAWKQGAGDYFTIREQLFEGETVNTLYDKIRAYEQREGPTN